MRSHPRSRGQFAYRSIGGTGVSRYIGDEEARAIAATGGLIGLWPMGFRRLGMRDVDDFARHASYLAELVGPRHLCIGTDMNGIPGYAKGSTGPLDSRRW